jgi:hypothetical protein
VRSEEKKHINIGFVDYLLQKKFIFISAASIMIDDDEYQYTTCSTIVTFILTNFREKYLAAMYKFREKRSILVTQPYVS